MDVPVELFVFTFVDGKNNHVEIIAPSKTKAREAVKQINLGQGFFRYESHRPMTPEERSQRRASMKKEAEERRLEDAKESLPPNLKLVRRRLAYGRNDLCPCGSGRKVRRCCGRKGTIEDGQGPTGPASGAEPPRP